MGEVQKIKAYLVRSLVDGFRRAGMEFNRIGRTIAEHELTEDQVKALFDEPMLSVTETTVEAEPPAAGEDAGAGGPAQAPAKTGAKSGAGQSKAGAKTGAKSTDGAA